MPNAFHGAFVFRRQDHGILTATYFNTGEYKPYPETAILKTESGHDTDPFIGDYITIWLERNTHYKFELNISPHNTLGVYKLSWKPISPQNGEKPYEGFGMLENGLLIGFYY